MDDWNNLYRGRRHIGVRLGSHQHSAAGRNTYTYIDGKSDGPELDRKGGDIQSRAG